MTSSFEGIHLSECPRLFSGSTMSRTARLISLSSGNLPVSTRHQTRTSPTQTSNTPGSLLGRIATSPRSFSKVTSSSCAIHPARSPHRQPGQYSIRTRGYRGAELHRNLDRTGGIRKCLVKGWTNGATNAGLLGFVRKVLSAIVKRREMT